MSWLGHEIEYRGESYQEKIQNSRVMIVGIGAIGSHLCFNLLKQGVEDIDVFDKDKVEEKNIGTQIFGLQHVGMKKTEAMDDIAFTFLEKCVIPFEIDIVKRPNVAKRASKSANVVIDCLDNREAREALYVSEAPLLHAGIGDGFGEVKWDEKYIIPKDDPEQDDLCEFPVARNLITIVASLLAESVIQFITKGSRVNYEISFSDMHILNA